MLQYRLDVLSPRTEGKPHLSTRQLRRTSALVLCSFYRAQDFVNILKLDNTMVFWWVKIIVLKTFCEEFRIRDRPSYTKKFCSETYSILLSVLWKQSSPLHQSYLFNSFVLLIRWKSHDTHVKLSFYWLFVDGIK